MSGRRYLTLIAVGLTALIAAFTVGQKLTTARDSQGEVRRDAGPGVGPAAIGELVAGNNAFAFDLFHALPQGESNLFFSPYGISTALAMTYAGARGETAEQMAEVLHYTLPQAQLHPAIDALNQHLTATDDEGEFELTLANALWGQEDEKFRQEYLDLLATDYGAGMRLVSFQSETGRRAAGERINRWVSDATAGRIPELVDPLLFTERTRLVLTNAIAFDGLWEVPFDDTQNGIFRLSDGSAVIVRLMQRRALTPYASGETWQAAELGYRGGRAHMLVLLPAEGHFDEFAQGLDAARVGEIAAALTPTLCIRPRPDAARGTEGDGDDAGLFGQRGRFLGDGEDSAPPVDLAGAAQGLRGCGRAGHRGGRRDGGRDRCGGRELYPGGGDARRPAVPVPHP
jgi:hypothetical protein